MDCPKCKKSSFDYHGMQRVLECRNSKGRVRRRRACPSCGFKFTTYEVYVGELSKVEELQIYKDKFQSKVKQLQEIVVFNLDKIILELD